MRFVTLILLFGCVGAVDDDDDDEDKEDEEESETDSPPEETEPPPFVPTEGEWTAIDGEVTQDDCDLVSLLEGQPAVEPGSFSIEEAKPVSFVMVTGEVGDTERFDCDLAQADLSFFCPPKDVVLSLAPDLPGTELVFNITASGIFADETHMQADQLSVISCRGDDCGLMEDFGGIEFPCTLGLHSTAAHP